MIRFGGSYNLRESEGKSPNSRKLVATENCAPQNDSSGQFITCSVFFLDDTESAFQVTVSFHAFKKIKKFELFAEKCDWK